MKFLAHTFSICLMVLVAAEICNADVVVDAGGQARLVTEPSGLRDDNNGGDTSTGALIGINTGGVDNFMIFDFTDLSLAAGETVLGATINFDVATGFSHGTHGSVDDIINLHEIAIGNRGWDRGTGTITGGDNAADDGSVSFLNRVQFNGSGTSESWVDSGGTDVANLLGSFAMLDSQNGWNSGSAPLTLSFTVDAATAQGWVDNGLGGIALSTTDNGNGNSRFNFLGNGNSSAGSITFVTAVPEPGSAIVLATMGMMLCIRRKRR